LTGKLLPEDGLVRWRGATEFMTTEIHVNFRPFFFNAPQRRRTRRGRCWTDASRRSLDNLTTSHFS
jgi:glutathione S-transferase